MGIQIRSSGRGTEVAALRTGWSDGNNSINIGATATSYTPSQAIVGLSSDVGYHLNIGGTTAATTDFYVPANVVWFVIAEKQPIWCKSATGGNGALYISEAL